MQVILNEAERALLCYIAEHLPLQSKAVLEYAKHSGIDRGAVKQTIELLAKHGIITYVWDGYNARTKRWTRLAQINPVPNAMHTERWGRWDALKED